ncbi:beta-ketoacyl synthase-like protein [Hydromonas duriensis]|uniref:Beta-ketoacyl synthase-like protein n=2 Tax=Hydromonas duriensis TaxID=1527608 RepID=A0A4R6Y314_9BURK|nr:beta-ketoacyl synthase-like protein [Hydromonas duriensis]
MGYPAWLKMKSTIHFSIKGWSAWAPGLCDAKDWVQWSFVPFCPNGDESPNSSAIPPMQRRRLNRITRMVYHVVDHIPRSNEVAQVYCSRHGDLAKSTELLVQLAHRESLSSLNFGLSVHNAVAGNISILQHNNQEITSLAAGRDGLVNALVETTAQCYDNQKDVLLVVYDETVPLQYSADLEFTQPAVFAYALLISVGNDYSIDWQNRQDEFTPMMTDVPTELDFFAWFLNKQQKSWSYLSNATQWHIHRIGHDGNDTK